MILEDLVVGKTYAPDDPLHTMEYKVLLKTPEYFVADTFYCHSPQIFLKEDTDYACWEPSRGVVYCSIWFIPSENKMWAVAKVSEQAYKQMKDYCNRSGFVLIKEWELSNEVT